MRILSRGDLIESGTYSLHSSFDKVLNFKSGGRIVSFVLPEMGPGPVNMVADSLPTVSKFSIRKNKISVNAEDFPLKKIKKYSSSFSITNKRKFAENMIHCFNGVKRSAPPESSAFLFREAAGAETGAFEKAFRKKFAKAAEKIVSGDLTGFSKLKGMGRGLTPSGDDFIAGYLLGINICEKLYNLDLRLLKRKIYLKGKGANLLSNSFMFCYYKGRVDFKMKSLLRSLQGNRLSAVKKDLKAVMACGHASGSDVLSGMTFALCDLSEEK